VVKSETAQRCRAEGVLKVDVDEDGNGGDK
jgi:hypothetical protein